MNFKCLVLLSLVGCGPVVLLPDGGAPPPDGGAPPPGGGAPQADGGTTPPGPVMCSGANCAGCCDSAGVCQAGTADAVCGLKGAACGSCGSADACSAGVCAPRTTQPPMANLPCAALSDALLLPAAVPLGRESLNGVCIPISVSWVVDRGDVRTSHARCLEDEAVLPPGAGSFNVSRNSAGRVSRVSYSPSGAGEGFTKSFDYTSGGLLSRWSLSYSGPTQGVSESFSYTSSGRLSSWSRSYTGPTQGVSESFSYTSSGRMSSWSRSYTGPTQGVSESFSYTSSGRMSSWSRSYTGPTEGVSESFSYTSSGRVSSWSRSYTGPTTTQSASISYSSSGEVSSINSSGPGLGGLRVAVCNT